jgi:hypothetical protein
MLTCSSPCPGSRRTLLDDILDPRCEPSAAAPLSAQAANEVFLGQEKLHHSLL